MSMENKEYPTASLDLSTGMCVYKGRTMTYKELEDLWEQEIWEEQDAQAMTRDHTLDGEQNLWGSKPNYKDDWYRRKKPLRKRKGYPSELDKR